MLTAFPAMLVKLRTERALSQREAASELGISQALLSHYENGIREPRLEFVVKLCDYYNVSADLLLGRVEEDSCQVLQKLAGRIQELAEAASQLINKPAKPQTEEERESI